jgi:methyl-accepting chemotaxis protein
MKADIRMRKNISLKTRAYGFFLVFFFVSLTLGAVFIHGVAVLDLDEQLFTVLSRLSSDQEAAQSAAIDIILIIKQLQNKALWVFFISLSGSLIVSFFIVQNLFCSLEKVTKIASKISRGHLDEVVPNYPCNEIGMIGRVINDFAVNFQEVLLLLWNQTQNCLRQLNQMDEKNEKNNKTAVNLDERLQHMRNHLEEMQAMIRSFEYYGVRFEDGKLFAQQDRVQSSPISHRRQYD